MAQSMVDHMTERGVKDRDILEVGGGVAWVGSPSNC